ncbi:MAG TPA: hypothetical protein VIF62_25835, partial [Labilithrix sp.]
MRGSFFTCVFAAALFACGSSSSRSFTDNGTDGTDPTAGDDGSGATPAPTPPPQPDKPGCAQTAYTEALPTSASLSDLAYSAANAQSYMISALDRRYPVGKFILQGGLSSPLSAQQGSCFDRFIQDKSSADSVLNQAET